MEPSKNIITDLASVLKVNQKIEVYFDHSEFMEEYLSRMERITDRDLGISMPTRRRVPLNTHCWVYFVYKDQRYGFEATVQGYERDNIVLMILSRPTDVLRLQRRKYFRVPIDLPMTCRISNPAEGVHEDSIRGTMRNISSGGVLMLTEQEIPLGCELLLLFSLDEEVDLGDIPARIVRAGVVEKRRRDSLYEYGVEFYDIHSRLRDTIMRFVFARQIELNRVKRT